jgi:hypothetical protein
MQLKELNDFYLVGRTALSLYYGHRQSIDLDPMVDFIKNSLGGHCKIIPIPVPLDCKDGFQEAFYGRPEAFLNKQVRLSQSAWGFIPEDKQEKIIERLKIDLENGTWDNKYGHFRTQAFFTCALRLIVATP